MTKAQKKQKKVSQETLYASLSLTLTKYINTEYIRNLTGILAATSLVTVR
jgi:hypothetical protein